MYEDGSGTHLSPGSESQPRLFGLVKKNLALAMSLLAGLLVILTLLTTANWNLNTAKALLSVAGTTSLVFGSMLNLGPTLLVSLQAVLTASLIHGNRIKRRLGSTVLTILVVSISVFGAQVLPLWMFVFACLYSLVLDRVTTLVSRSLSTTKEPVDGKPRDLVDSRELDSSNKTLRSMNILVVLALLIGAIQVPWLPTESVHVGDLPAYTGYIVGTRDSRTYVLDDRTRLLENYDESTVVHELCEKSPLGSKSLIDLVFHTDRYENCPIPSDGENEKGENTESG